MLHHRPVIVVSALFLALALCSPATSQAPQEFKLTASGAAAGDSFGFSVALSGDTVLVGGNAFRKSGSAHVFLRGGTGWIQQAKLTPNDAAARDDFGISVALSGDTAIVGNPRDDHAGIESGSAYVFVRSGTTWIQQQKLTASDAAFQDAFGFSVALSGDTAIVGSLFDDSGTGSVYVFIRSGAAWIQQTKLTASDAAAKDHFGYSISLSGDTALVGAGGNDDAGSGSGSAYVFVRTSTNWSPQQKLTSAGGSVALSGDTAIVADYEDDHAGSRSGSAYVFVRSGTSWSQQAKLTASDAATLDLFGHSVALDGDTALVGANGDDDAGSGSGSAYVYELALAHVSEFGAGCAGSLAVPVLQPVAGSRPKTGGTFDVALSDLPANNPAFLILGLSNAQWLSTVLPMSLAPFGAPGCSLLVSGDFFTGVVNTTGTATQGFPIPLDLSLVGLHIYFQGYVEDPGANGFGVAVSNALDITIGSL